MKTMTKKEDNVVQEEAVEHANSSVIVHGMFAGLILPISIGIGFLATWIVAYERLGALGILLNAILLVCIASIVSKATAGNEVDIKDEKD
jgi:hypothetical protein